MNFQIILEQALHNLQHAYQELTTPMNRHTPDYFEKIMSIHKIAKTEIAVFISAGQAAQPFLPKLKALVKKYDEQTEHRYNTLIWGVLRDLKADIKQIEFNLNIPKGICGCNFRKTINLPFNNTDINWLKKIGHHERASIYDFPYTVYECRQCKTKWTHEMNDDTDDGFRWVLWNENDHPI